MAKKKQKRPFEVLAVNEANVIEALLGLKLIEKEHQAFIEAVETLLNVGAQTALDVVSGCAIYLRQQVYRGAK